MNEEDSLFSCLLDNFAKYIWNKELKKAKKFEKIFFWLLEKGKEKKFLSLEEFRIIIRAFRFKDTTVREIMIPGPEMVCAEVNTPITKIIELIIEKGHSRLPIYKEHFDNIIGILHAKNLLKIWLSKEKNMDLTKILIPPLFVPETQKINTLLKEMNTRHIHLAIVVDEHGSTVGLVTIEDIIEEIFGEIQDEYDREAMPIVQTTENTWRVRAGIDLDELGEILGIEFPEGKYETLAGFLIHLTGTVPKPKEVVYYKNFEFTILSATPRRLQEIMIKKIK
ncbi:MAG TPA: HlyC/CorC family transporter [Candidatus Desulfofervidus auxilii]|uniref:HlyC/CorC family transporter n=1 Tax=Desulfofervidus auxilii TaxID=1621989 RepID=A0A7C0Y608_DESA2|nr:HlyC/CorC family transporter [Candidatus Desulfofervidus auxilii]